VDIDFLVVSGPPRKGAVALNIVGGCVELFSDFANYVDVISAQPRARKFVIPITSLDDEKLELKAPIDAIVTVVDGEYIVDFPSAEISVSERSLVDAIAWLKSRIIGSYRRFDNERAILGPGPRRQLTVLEGYIGEKSAP
jgi:hypothetical protein